MPSTEPKYKRRRFEVTSSADKQEPTDSSSLSPSLEIESSGSLYDQLFEDDCERNSVVAPSLSHQQAYVCDEVGQAGSTPTVINTLW